MKGKDRAEKFVRTEKEKNKVEIGEAKKKKERKENNHKKKNK